jgi:hypothetical protein
MRKIEFRAIGQDTLELAINNSLVQAERVEVVIRPDLF